MISRKVMGDIHMLMELYMKASSKTVSEMGKERRQKMES
jgi:hypothetical protein